MFRLNDCLGFSGRASTALVHARHASNGAPLFVSDELCVQAAAVKLPSAADAARGNLASRLDN